jgi:guanylate kinase
VDAPLAARCFEQVRTILQAERLKRSRQTGLIGFVRKLTAPPEAG